MFIINGKEISKENLIKKLKVPIKELDLSFRAYNCLRQAEINCLSKLVQYDKEDLLKIKNLGIKSFREIEQVVEKERELGFGMDLSVFFDKNEISDDNIPELSDEEINEIAESIYSEFIEVLKNCQFGINDLQDHFIRGAIKYREKIKEIYGQQTKN